MATNVKNKYSMIMEKIDRILHDLDQGNANVTDTKKLVLDLFSVSYQRELLLAYHKHLDSFNDPTIYNASESMIDDYLANNCS